jgi:hypothetical protein
MRKKLSLINFPNRRCSYASSNPENDLRETRYRIFSPDAAATTHLEGSSRRALAKPEPVIRFETDTGCQMQADFVTIGRGRDRLAVFIATLV